MDKGMTAKELATLFGVWDTAVLNWEIGGKMPTGESLEKMKGFLEI